MRTVKRPRKYISRHLLVLLSPWFRYSAPRDAYVLRAIGRRVGPVLRQERRSRHGRRRWREAERRRALA